MGKTQRDFLMNESMKSIKSKLKQFGSTLASAASTVALSLIPVLKSCPPCPLCMPKYAAILSFLGLPLADYSHYLVPVMILSMAFTCVSMSWQSYRYTHEWRPAILAILSCSSILVARSLDMQMLAYTGMGTLLVAVVLHQWKMKNRSACCSSHCHHPCK